MHQKKVSFFVLKLHLSGSHQAGIKYTVNNCRLWVFFFICSSNKIYSLKLYNWLQYLYHSMNFLLFHISSLHLITMIKMICRPCRVTINSTFILKQMPASGTFLIFHPKIIWKKNTHLHIDSISQAYFSQDYTTSQQLEW